MFRQESGGCMLDTQTIAPEHSHGGTANRNGQQERYDPGVEKGLMVHDPFVEKRNLGIHQNDSPSAGSLRVARMMGTETEIAARITPGYRIQEHRM